MNLNKRLWSVAGIIVPAFVFHLMLVLNVFAWDSETVHSSGSPNNRVNIVFLGDGYQANEIAKYKEDVRRAVNHLKVTSPFKEYLNYLNIYRVDVISSQSGADHPPNRFVNTALDTSFNIDGIQRCVYSTSIEKVYEAADSAPARYTPGMIVVLVNDPEPGGCALDFAVVSTSSDYIDVVPHELAHSFGILADEYDGTQARYPYTEPFEANVTKIRTRPNIKWKHWIEQSTPIPTTSSEAGLVGLFEGASNYNFGIFRPTYDSKMRSVFQPFYEVNTERLLTMMYNRVSPVDDVSPDHEQVVMTSPQTFSVTMTQPLDHNLNARWFLNGQQISTMPQILVTPAMLKSGANYLQVVVKDPTPFMRFDQFKLTQDSVSWDVMTQNLTTIPAKILRPTLAETIDGSPYGLVWDSGISIAQYWLSIGTTQESIAKNDPAMSGDLFSKDMLLKRAVVLDEIPLNGNPVYVRLWSKQAGTTSTWLYHDYVFATDNATVIPAALTSPPSGTRLPNGPIQFEWDSGNKVDEYWLSIGPTLGSRALYDRSQGSNRSVTVTDVSFEGLYTVYVRLWSYINYKWHYRDYTYDGWAVRPAITSPVTGSTISNSTVNFVWNAGSAPAADQYHLQIGTSVGGSQIFNVNVGDVLSKEVSGIVLNGQTLYVRLWWRAAGVWRSRDYTFLRANIPTVNPDLLSPVTGSTITNSTTNFVWNAGSNPSADQYHLQVGTTAGGSQIFNVNVGNVLSKEVSGIVLNGQTLYVRLWWRAFGVWKNRDYTYARANVPTVNPAITSPDAENPINSLTVNFVWNAGSAPAADQYHLQVGTSLGGKQIFDMNVGNVLSKAVSGIPLNGQALYVRLWWRAAGVWKNRDYTFARANVPTTNPEVLIPAPGSTIINSTTHFVWNAGSAPAADQFHLQVGTTLGGKQIFDMNVGNVLHKEVSGIALNGKTLYVRLWWRVAGVWKKRDYTYLRSTLPTVNPAITSPVNQILTSTVNFVWNTGSNPPADQYHLQVGTSIGGTQIFDLNVGNVLSKQVSGITQNGQSVYVRLWWRAGGKWKNRDYTFTTSQ